MLFRTSLLILLLMSASAQAESRLHVFAAASLSAPLQSITHSFIKKAGIEVSITFASSSALARQIKQGAPASVFITANPDWLDYIEKDNLTLQKSRRTILSNRLVIAAHKEQDIDPFSFPEHASVKRLKLDSQRRIATGNPEHVPLGMYAKEALSNSGLWQSWRPLLAPSNSARSALALTERQETLIGIHYESDIQQSNKLKRLSIIPESYHTPIRYEVSLIRGDKLDPASQYYDYLFSKEAGSVFRHYGFIVLDSRQ